MGRQIGPLLVATLALSMASCGGDDAPPPEPERPQITKARLIERADAICTRDQARATARLERLPKPERSARIGAITARILEVNEAAVRSGADRIEALGRPASDADLLEDYLDERTSAANALRGALAAARKEDTEGLAAALRTYNRNQAQEAATRFGFKVCGLGAGRIGS
ncbi:MAG: hypothetical protein Q8K79_02840 [Solirubrobacteraceae bacterium]|nr:hypothetical protein [Solirubrobacteraceae bacterium]